ncbi:PPE domain-containing protein [Prauserella oleivorans]
MDASGISVLVDKISDHRFDGYTDNMLADEIERFRSGPGISGISDAVSALKEVASALAETEETLRVELGKLGVAWQGAAGDRAGRAVVQQADFSTDARDTVTDAAERIFAQGEAFNRTLHKLPDAQALRDGARGYGLLDSISSLLGFETDNTRKVAQAREARAQALEALNAYARDSGENLSGLREISAPQAVRANTGPVVPREIDAGGGPGEVTTASGAVRAPVAAPASAPGASAPTPAPMSAPATGPAPVSAPGANAPTPAYGTPLPQAPASGAGAGAGSGPARPVVQPTAPQSTAPSSVASVTAAAAGFVGAARHTQQQSSGGAPGTSGVSGAPATPGGPGAPGTTGVPGAVAPGTPGCPARASRHPATPSAASSRSLPANPVERRARLVPGHRVRLVPGRRVRPARSAARRALRLRPGSSANRPHRAARTPNNRWPRASRSAVRR